MKHIIFCFTLTASQCEELDAGDPIDLGKAYKAFSRKLKQLNVFGGCCGTDHRHVEAICHALNIT